MKLTHDLVEHSSAGVSRFAPQVAQMRNSFFTEAETLPLIIRNTVVDHYQNRIQRGKGKPMLGEYVPWILKDILGLKNERAVQKISPSWMNLYAYSLFMDDILDHRTEEDAAPLLLASGLLLQRGLSGFFGLFPTNKNVRVRVDELFVETAGAVMHELLQHKQKLSRFTPRNFDQIGRKVSFLKLCATGLLAENGISSKAMDELLVPIEHLATGMQLLDDITDWEEDWRAENYSFLLTEAFSKLTKIGVGKSKDLQSFTKSEVFAAIVLTGALEKALAKALTYLSQVQQQNAGRAPSAATKLLEIILAENSTFKNEVECARYACLAYVAKKKYKNWLSIVRENSTPRRRLNYLEKKLTIIATNS